MPNGREINEQKARQVFDYLNTQTSRPSTDFEKFKSKLSEDPVSVFKAHSFLSQQQELGLLPQEIDVGGLTDFQNSLFISPVVQAKENIQPEVRRAGSRHGEVQPLGEQLGGLQEAAGQQLFQRFLQQEMQRAQETPIATTAVAEPVIQTKTVDDVEAEGKAKTMIEQQRQRVRDTIARQIQEQGLEGEEADIFAINQLSNNMPQVDIDEASLKMAMREDGPGAARSAIGNFVQGLTGGVAGLSESIAIAAQRLDGLVGLNDKELQDYATFQYGQWLRKTAEELFPANPEFQDDFIVGTLASGAGSLTGFALGGLGGKLLKLSGRGTAAMLGAGSIASDEYQAALEATGDEEKAFRTFLFNLAIGSAEALPLTSFFSRLEKWSGGGLKKVLKSGVAGGLEEMTQETVSQTLTNLTAQQMYDESRELVEGLKEGGAAGFILGFAMNAIGIKVKQELRRRDIDNRSKAMLEATMQYINDERAKLPQDDGEVVIEKQFNEQLKKENDRISNIKKDLATKDLSDDAKSTLQRKLDEAEQDREARKEEIKADIRAEQLHKQMSDNLQKRKESIEKEVDKEGISDETKAALSVELESIDKAIKQVPTKEQLAEEFRKRKEEPFDDTSTEEQPITERTFRLESGLSEDQDLPTEDNPVRTTQRGIAFDYFTRQDEEGNPQYFKKRLTEEERAETEEDVEPEAAPTIEEQKTQLGESGFTEEQIESLSQGDIGRISEQGLKPADVEITEEGKLNVKPEAEERVKADKPKPKKKPAPAKKIAEPKKVQVEKKVTKKKPIIKISNVDIEKALTETKKEAKAFKARGETITKAVKDIRAKNIQNIEQGTATETGQAIDDVNIVNTAFNTIEDGIKSGFSVSRSTEQALRQVKKTGWYRQKIDEGAFIEQEFDNAFTEQFTQDIEQSGIADSDIKSNEAARIESERVIDEFDTIRKGVKDESIFNPQDLKDRLDESINNLIEAKKNPNLSNTFLAGIQDKKVNDIKKKIDEAKSFEQLSEATDEMNEVFDNLADSELRKSLLSSINKELSEKTFIVRGGEKIGKFSPEVSRILKSYKEQASFKNPESLRLKKLQITSEWVQNNPGEFLPESVVEQLQELNRTHLKHLSNDELVDILEEVRSLKQQGKTFNRLKRERQERINNEIVSELENNITGGRGVLKPEPTREIVTGDTRMKGILAKTLNFFNILTDIFALKRQLTPETLIDMLDENAKSKTNEGKSHKYMIGQINAAEAVKIDGMRNKLNDVQNKLNELGIENNLRKKVKVTPKLELTRNEMIDVFIKTHDPAILASMIKGNKLTPDLINKITNELTKEEKAFGKFILEFYDSSYGELNNVYKKIHFMDLPKNKGYSPMIKVKEELNKSESINLLTRNTEYTQASVFKPFVKERVGSEAPVRLDALGTLVDYISRTEHYKAYEVTIRRINNVLNKLKPAIVQEHGRLHYDLLKGWVKDVAGDGRFETTDAEKFFLSMRKNLTTAFLGINPIVAMKQAVSGLSFLTEINEGQFVKGVSSYVSNKKSWDEFWNQIPEIANRSETITRDIKEITRDRDALEQITRRKGIREKVSFAGIRAMDKMTVRSGATAVYLANGGKLGKPINEVALEKALGAVRRTQVTGNIKDLPALQRGGTMGKLLTMFQGQPVRYFNAIYSNIRAARKGRITKGQLSRALFYSWVMPTAAFALASQPFRDEEDLLEDIITAPFRYLLIFGSMYDSMRSGFDPEFSPVFGLLKKESKRIKKIWSSNSAEEIKDLMETFAADEFLQGELVEGILTLGEVVANVKGVPTRPIRRFAEGLSKILNGESEGIEAWMRLVWSDWALKKAEEEPEILLEQEEHSVEEEEAITEAEESKFIE